jgi:DNA repair photolyase
MQSAPPDELIFQTHTHRVLDQLDFLRALHGLCRLRVQVSIESDRDRLPGLPPPASTVQQRLAACARLQAAGVFTVVTVAPLLPIENPDEFFGRIAVAADAVVLDHFIGGDGSADGARTLRTSLPAAIARVDPEALQLAYRDRMAEIARRYFPERVGISMDGFAGRYLPAPNTPARR